MDNKEFEKKLEQIKQFKEVPLSVDKKIQKAFEKIEENEKLEKESKKQKSKFKFSRVLSLAASFVMAIFLAGNGVAYAKGEPNIYSWVLEKIGIQREYEEIKTEINQTVESNGVKITLLDAGCDKNFLVVGYKIQSEEGFFKDIDDIEGIRIWDSYLLQEKDGTVIGKFDSMMGDHYMANKISDKEYILYSIRDISDCDIKVEELYISINIGTIEGTDINGNWIEDAEIKGKWNFIQESIGFGDTNYKEYVIDINKAINEEFKINSIRVINTKMFSAIYVDREQNIDYDKYEGTPKYCIVVLEGKDVIVDSIDHLDFHATGSAMFSNKLQENKIYTIEVHKRVDDPKNAGVIIEDNTLYEFTIELNKEN